LFALTPLCVAAVVVLARPAARRDWVPVRLRLPGLIWGAAGVHAVLVTDPSWAAGIVQPLGGLWPALAGWALGFAFVVVNLPGAAGRARPGLVALAAGFTLNTVVRAVNLGMPYSVTVARLAGASADRIATPTPGHRPMSAHTVLPYLSDVIPVPGLRTAMSIGDLLMVIGIAWFVAGTAGAHRAGSMPTTKGGELDDGTVVAAGVPDRHGRRDARRGGIRARGSV
jgi:hypothetical protein